MTTGAPGPRVWVVGDLMLDRTASGPATRLSPEAPVPVVTSSTIEAAAGGAANLARNLRAQGAEVAIAGIVGDDDAGAELRALVADDGIGISGVLMRPDARTTTKLRVMADGHHLVRVDDEVVSVRPPADIDAMIDGLRSDLARPDAVVISDYDKGVVGPGLARRLGGATGAPVFADPKGTALERYRTAALVSPNLREASVASGLAIVDEDTLHQAVDAIRAHLPGTDVLVTRGALGMSLFPAGLSPPHHARAVAQRAFDVSGAGDTALAALVVAHLQGAPWPDAMATANLAGSIAVSRVGTAVVGASEVRALARERAAAAGEHAPILLRDELAARAASWRTNGDRIVFTNGCFDLLHRGHVELLRQARALGDVLVVAINDDASVRRLKGAGRPVADQVDRAAILAELRSVDAVTVFSEDSPLETIRACRPHVLVKGDDYELAAIVGRDEMSSWGGTTTTIATVAGVSSTRLRARAAAARSDPDAAVGAAR